MADRNKEALLEVRCKFSHFDYTPAIYNLLFVKNSKENILLFPHVSDCFP